MLEQWYYTQRGIRRGPVSSKELKALSDSGHLQPADLVWKEGMRGWKRASKVRGLFPRHDFSKPPPLPPNLAPQAQPAGPGIPSAIKGIFAAISGAAQQLWIGPPAGKPRGHPQTSSPLPFVTAAPSAALSDSGEKPPQGLKGCSMLMLAGVLGMLSLVGVALLVSYAARSSKGEFVLNSFDDHPPPILQSIREGKEVWLLDDFRITTGEPSLGEKSAYYLVLVGDRLEYVASKGILPHALDRDALVTWSKSSAGETRNKTSRNNFVEHWEGKRNADGSIDLTFNCTLVMDDASGNTIESQTSLKARVVPRRTDEVSWSSQMRSTSQLTYSKFSGKGFPPKTSSISLRGSAKQLR